MRGSSESVRSLAGHALLQVVGLLFDPLPAFRQTTDVHVHVPQSIIMVRWVLVVEPALHEEARSRYMRDDPLCLPSRIGVSMDGWRAKEDIRILLVPFRQTGLKSCMDVGVCREAGKVGER